MKNFIKNTISWITIFGYGLDTGDDFSMYSQQDHKKIVEEVSVSWRQVPVFAVDKLGKPVTDLEPGDIKVKLKSRQIPSF